MLLSQRLISTLRASGGCWSSGGGSGPGPQEMIYDAATDTGYYGEVSAADLVTGAALASAIGLSAGAAMADAGWLKFYVGPNADCNRGLCAYVLFVAKMPLRRAVSWNNINAVRPVDGSGAAITIGDDSYKVRLLTGADANPSTHTSGATTCATNPGATSEWNDLFYRIHADVPNCATPTVGMQGGSATTRHGGPQVGGNWDDLTDAETGVMYTLNSGSVSWCQEVNGASRVYRGVGGVAFFTANPPTFNDNNAGWRPALELVR